VAGIFIEFVNHFGSFAMKPLLMLMIPGCMILYTHGANFFTLE